MALNIGGNTGFIPLFKPSYKNEEAKKSNDEKAALLKQQETEEKDRLKAQQQARQTELDMLKQQLESSNEQAEATEDSFKAFSKCLIIAQRITKGDKVPTQDIKYLMEHEPDLYKQAIMFRQPNPKPKEHDTVLEDEDLEKNATDSFGAGYEPSTSEEAVSSEVSTSPVIFE